MKFEHISEAIVGVPYILPQLSWAIYEFITSRQPQRCLELGFGHGASSCYIAAALDEVGHGHLDTVDLIGAQQWQKPNIETLLAKVKLTDRVTIHRETTQYTWFLMKRIREQTREGQCEPVYDFCFIDGAKNWTIDGCAFFLVDKLLKPGGWILFDDLNWVYRKKINEGKFVSDGVDMRSMGDDELDTPHLDLVFQYLVRQHPGYSNFEIMDDWFAWAEKNPNGSREVKRCQSEAFKARNA